MVYLLHEVSSKALHNNHAALSNLKDVLDRAGSSSFANLPMSAVSAQDFVSAARVAGTSGLTVQSSELQGYLSEHPQLASNGKQDVIVVQFPEGADLATVDAEIASAEKAVTAVTNGAHAGMVASSLAPSTVSATNLAAEFNYRDSRTGVYYGTPSAFAPTSTGLTKTAPSNGLVGAANNQAGKALTYGPSRFLTPTLNLGILVTLYMLFVAISAFCCILSLQTPEMFEEDQKKAMHSALNPHN